MKTITPTRNKSRWPRHAVKSVEARKKDLIIRITDWTKDKDEPAYDVEVYIGGVYDWNESETHTFYQYKTKEASKAAAIQFAQSQIAKLL